MAPPSDSWRMILSQSNERPARRSRPGRRALLRCDRPSHTRRRSRPTCRRRRRRRPPAARRPERSRSRGRSGDARRATSRAAAGELACARGRRATEGPTWIRVPWRATALGRRLAPTPARDRPGRAPARRRAPAARPRRGSRRPHGQVVAFHAPSRPERARVPSRRRRSPSARSRTRAACPRTRRSDAPATGPATRSGRRRAARAASTTWRSSRTALVPASRRSRTARGARGRARAPFDGTRAGVTTPRRSRADSSPDQTGDAETSSRRSSCARSRSAGVLIGEKRPRGPRRGTSRYCAGTNAETSW